MIRYKSVCRHILFETTFRTGIICAEFLFFKENDYDKTKQKN